MFSALVTDDEKAIPNIPEKSLQMLDVVRYGSGDNLHFGNVLFRDDDGKVMVFSRLGQPNGQIYGPFDVHPIDDKDVTKAYGSVSGRFRPRN